MKQHHEKMCGHCSHVTLITLALITEQQQALQYLTDISSQLQ